MTQSYWRFPDWVSCPECGSTDVHTYAGYDGDIGFECMNPECGHAQDQSHGEFVDSSECHSPDE